MKQIRMSEELDTLQFVIRAKKDFNAHPRHATYGDLEPGSLFAMRFGLGNDCILVFRIDPECEIKNYVGMIAGQEGLKR